MTREDRWGRWQLQLRSDEQTSRVRAWYRRVECPTCSAAVNRVCRSASGYPTGHHRARRDSAGSPPYEEWHRQGLIPEHRPTRPAPDVLLDSHKSRMEFNTDVPLADAVAIVRQILKDPLGFALENEAAVDRLDDAAQTLVMVRGPEGSADLITVLAFQVAMLVKAHAAGNTDLAYIDQVHSWMTQARSLQSATRPRPTERRDGR
ncbi:zinc finger domain-containing protein [Streptomyces sp. NPDC004682]